MIPPCSRFETSRYPSRNTPPQRGRVRSRAAAVVLSQHQERHRTCPPCLPRGAVSESHPPHPGRQSSGTTPLRSSAARLGAHCECQPARGRGAGRPEASLRAPHCCWRVVAGKGRRVPAGVDRAACNGDGEAMLKCRSRANGGNCGCTERRGSTERWSPCPRTALSVTCETHQTAHSRGTWSRRGVAAPQPVCGWSLHP